MDIVKHLPALGGTEKSGRIYITGFWEKLLNAKVEFVFRNGNNRLQSFKVGDIELVHYGTDPRNNERTRRDLLNFRRSMAYTFFDIKNGQFEGVNGAELYYLHHLGVIVMFFHGKIVKISVKE